MACGDCGKIAHGVAGLVKVAAQSVGIPIDQASNTTIQSRRDKCRACPEATRNPHPKHAATNGLTSLSQCSLCGCNIAAKTRIASETCPVNQWGPQPATNNAA